MEILRFSREIVFPAAISWFMLCKSWLFSTKRIFLRENRTTISIMLATLYFVVNIISGRISTGGISIWLHSCIAGQNKNNLSFIRGRIASLFSRGTQIGNIERRIGVSSFFTFVEPIRTSLLYLVMKASKAFYYWSIKQHDYPTKFCKSSKRDRICLQLMI